MTPRSNGFCRPIHPQVHRFHSRWLRAFVVSHAGRRATNTKLDNFFPQLAHFWRQNRSLTGTAIRKPCPILPVHLSDVCCPHLACPSVHFFVVFVPFPLENGCLYLRVFFFFSGSCIFFLSFFFILQTFWEVSSFSFLSEHFAKVLASTVI